MSTHHKTFFVFVVLVFTFLGATMYVMWRQSSYDFEDARQPLARSGHSPSTPATSLEAREKLMDETVWAKEMLAQDCGRTFETLWDSLNASTNKLNQVAAFPVGEIVLGQWNLTRTLPHGIQVLESSGPGPALSAAQWRHHIELLEQSGWELENTEFRQMRFDTDAAGQPWQSHFYFSAHLTQGVSQPEERAIIEGDLNVDWLVKQPGEKRAEIKRIDASHLMIKTRQGEAPFQLIQVEQIMPSDQSNYSDPLILYDLDGDGLPEIVLAAKNVVYHRLSNGHYESKPLCRYPPGLITTAVIADFDGDGFADFLCAKSEGLILFKGSARGTFDEPGRLVWRASSRLLNAMVMTCGDIDHDGTLEVFLGQYRVPTLGQILRPHYYDANDGHPAYLLRNNGHGSFSDITDSAGLESKRWRRIYSASLVDLDQDGYLDLATMSDFAGVDLYRNNGHGHFRDVTGEWVAESHGFGMAHALADFNVDGRLDLLMIGMPSPAVDRIEHLGLWRPDATEDHSMRARMSYGNRLYLARRQGGFEQTPLSDSMARSGWSWGCGAADFDNDGYPDVYIANGLQSKQSVRDYEPEFWLHDIYIGDKVNDVEATAYFLGKYSRTRGQGWSYGGYEKNRLYLNQRGQSFVEVGHLMGVALEQDCRNVAVEDLEGDGHPDLVVTTLEVWPEVKQTMRIYRNTLKDCGHWIGFRFREEGAGKSPVGIQVTVFYNNHKAIRHVVTGDSHRTQHSNTVHFGLGEVEKVDRVKIRWANGQELELQQPAVDNYYFMRAPASDSQGPGKAPKAKLTE